MEFKPGDLVLSTNFSTQEKEHVVLSKEEGLSQFNKDDLVGFENPVFLSLPNGGYAIVEARSLKPVCDHEPVEMIFTSFCKKCDQTL